MNTETNNRPVRKATIIIGFIALLVLIAWLSITIVKSVPGSFASLASLAESVRSFDASRVENPSDDEANKPTNGIQNMLVVTSDTNVSKSGDSVRLSWTDASKPGSFVFLYECTEGVTVDIVETNGTRSVACDTNYNLGDINNMVIAIESEKQRFVDVAYTLAFLETNDSTPSASTDAVITIVNDMVPIVFDPIAEVTDTAEEEIVTETPVTPVTPTEPEETFTQEFTYTIPVSDPNGRVDLSIKYLGVGQIVNNAFKAGIVDNDESGAVQFEVKNLGTKTSNDWTYEIALPAGGKLVSDDQAPLKPNERAVITIGFPASTVAEHTFTGSVETTGDNTSINNQFVETVTFKN